MSTQQLYTVDTLPKRLFGEDGKSLSKSTIYSWINSGQLKARKLGSSTVFVESDVVDFLESLPVYEQNDAVSVRAALRAKGGKP